MQPARYERRSLLVTSNLAFSERTQVFQGERMTATMLDRLTHRCQIIEMNGESVRLPRVDEDDEESPSRATAELSYRAE